MRVTCLDGVVDGAFVSRLRTTDDNGIPIDPTSVKLALVGPAPGGTQLEVEYPSAAKSRLLHPSKGNFKHHWWWLPSQAGRWTRRWIVDGEVVASDEIEVPAAAA